MGNTIKNHPPAVLAPVHPHACGEYPSSGGLDHHHGGSSPRVWGIRHPPFVFLGDGRFIPTRVGNTSIGILRGRPRAVHPHACGEYFDYVIHHASSGGSSPRVWGILITCSASRALSAVHPHACGEYPRVIVTDPTSSGSSPRVWGILFAIQMVIKFLRFIPTRVGNTFIK